MLAGQADCQSLSPFAVSDVGPAAAQSLPRQRNALPEGLVGGTPSQLVPAENHLFTIFHMLPSTSRLNLSPGRISSP